MLTPRCCRECMPSRINPPSQYVCLLVDLRRLDTLRLWMPKICPTAPNGSSVRYLALRPAPRTCELSLVGRIAWPGFGTVARLMIQLNMAICGVYGDSGTPASHD